MRGVIRHEMSNSIESSKKAALDSIAEMELLLRKYCVSNWAKSFAHHSKMLNRSFSAENIHNALKVFEGGMGSFNDLVICRANGHNVKEDKEKMAWHELEVLRQKVWKNLNECKNAL